MYSLVSNLDCGRVRLRKYKKDSTDHCTDFLETSFNEIDQKIIPFFKEYKVSGIKSQDFNDWCKAAELIKKNSLNWFWFRWNYKNKRGDE